MTNSRTPYDTSVQMAFLKSKGFGVPELTFDDGYTDLMHFVAHGDEKDSRKAYRFLEEAARHDIPDAQACLGMLLLDEGKPWQDQERGLNLLHRGADQGSRSALETLGRMYWHGQIVEHDEAKAEALTRLASKQGCCFANRQLEHITQIQDLRRAAERGDLEAAEDLGWRYQCGTGVPKNLVEAEHLQRRAAAGGRLNAQVRLGRMYLEGIGVEVNLAMAHYLFLQASGRGLSDPDLYLSEIYDELRRFRPEYQLRQDAAAGEADAQCVLGYLSEVGDGVIQDYVTAHMWFNLAAAQGHKIAASARNHLSKRLTPSQLEDAQDEARRWFSSL